MVLKIKPTTMTNRGNQPAAPTLIYEQYADKVTGMTIREKIAAMLPEMQIDFGSNTNAESFIGREMPSSNNPIEYLTYMAQIEAKLRVIRADASIEELSKPINP